MIKYKLSEDSEEIDKKIVQENHDGIDNEVFRLQQAIQSFYISFENKDFLETQTKSKHINSLLCIANEKISDFIINSDFLSFLSVQLNSSLPNEILQIILELVQSVLQTPNVMISQILHENDCLSALNQYLNIEYGPEIIKTVLICIGYATFDLYKISIEHFFELKSDDIHNILQEYDELYPTYINLLSNMLFCMRDYKSSIELIIDYIELIDFQKCEKKNISFLFKNIVQRIQYSSKNNHQFDYSFNVFQDTKLSQLLIDSLSFPEFMEANYPIEDVHYYALKLIITFLENDLDGSFYNQISLVQPNDYYNLIINSATTEKSIKKIFQLLTILMVEYDDDNYFINFFVSMSFLKTGIKNIFDYNSYFQLFGFKTKVWYLRFLDPFITKCVDIEQIENLLTEDFIEQLISFLEPGSLDICESALLLIKAILERTISDSLFYIVDFLMSRDLPFDDLIDELTDEIEDENIKELSLLVIRIFSEALTKRQMNPDL